MTPAFARNGEVEIAYETFGTADGQPLLLLSGLDYQMVWWPQALCTALAERGFHVARFDYRDNGLSTHFAAAVRGSPLRMLPYLHLGTFAKLATRRYGSGREQQERMLVDVLRATCTDTYPLDEDWARRTAAESYDRRPPDPAARQRQLAALRATKTPEGGLARITAPTLVIHGESDPLVRPAASRALTRAIPGTRLVTYPGMGHGLPPGLRPAALDEISTLVERQNTTSNPPAARAD